MKKKEVAIIFGVTSNYLFALANVLIGMKKHCKVFWSDIIVYHDGITEQDKKNINKILKCTFINFNNLHFNPNISEDKKKQYSLLAFARYECFNLLGKYKKVIWHDVDILIQKDFSPLLKYGDKTGFAATINDSEFLVESNFAHLIDGYNMFQPLYNSGIMILSDNIGDYKAMAEWCYDMTIKLADSLIYTDQGILNLLIQHFNIQVEEVDVLDFCCHPERSNAFKATIVHAYGVNKFWNNHGLLCKFPEWQENNEKWDTISNVKNEVSDKPRISVVLSVYNRYKFLPEAIESILNQTFSNFEFIVVIEFSEVQAEIEKLIKRYGDNRIIIIKNSERLGFPTSLNVGLDIAKGEYIARMDDDDISLPGRFEKQINFMDAHPEIGICGGYIEIFMGSEGVCTLPSDNEHLRVHALSATPLFHPTVMMRKKMLDDNNLRYDPNYFTEDYELWSRAISCTEIYNLPEVLLKYRDSGENATITASRKVHQSHVLIMKNQFANYLGIAPSDDEIILFKNRANNLANVHNKEAAQKILDNLYKKIIDVNKIKGFYSDKVLREAFNLDYLQNPQQKYRKLKKLVRKCLKPIRPLYNRFMNRIYSYVEYRVNDVNGIYDERCRKLEKRINELENLINNDRD